MEIYLVGGAVRDRLLGRDVHERDWVVVGGSVAEMEAAGYRQVGRDFPVFLHPATGEEYALARTERKTGPGHTGFEVHADAMVTLEQDLFRRDLTINAMAEDEAGRVIDPHGGRADLQAGLLRHVSGAFAEDPLRVFRVARFAARLGGFSVHPATLGLLREMAAANALAELSAERVWVELTKALDSDAPNRFFEVLGEAAAMAPWFAELRGYPLPDLTRIAGVGPRYALLASVLTTAAAETLAERLKTPRSVRQLAAWLVSWGDTLASWRRAEAKEVYLGLNAAKAFKPTSELAQRLEVVGAACTVADDLDDLLALANDIGRTVTAERYQRQGLSGAELGAALEAGRIEALRAGQ